MNVQIPMTDARPAVSGAGVPPACSNPSVAFNHQIQELAPMLNSPSIAGGAAINSASPEAPVAFTLKRYQNAAWLFAVGMSDRSTRVTFKVHEFLRSAEAE